ncbi:MAG: M23 family metallopeptidase [Balneolaceae bacterium]
MSDRKHYVYDTETCQFIPIQYSKKDKAFHTISIWVLSSIVFASIGLGLLSAYTGTPAEIALKAENHILLEQLSNTQTSILRLEEEVESIAQTDNEMYRSVLGMEPLSNDAREPGTGGTDLYSEFDLYSADAAELLKWTASRLDNLERRLNVQRMSFEEIQLYYNENQERLRHLPAIRPLSGILISGFGMRVHPIFKYRRMHEGIDFRADVGTEIYATGEGVVKTAGRRGNYGIVLEIDHGFGYLTRYAHLSGFAEGVRAGTRVERGQLVGYTGNTGLTEGPHLHYEIRIDGQAVDPLNYLFADITPEEYLMFREVAESNPKSMD